MQSLKEFSVARLIALSFLQGMGYFLWALFVIWLVNQVGDIYSNYTDYYIIMAWYLVMFGLTILVVIFLIFLNGIKLYKIGEKVRGLGLIGLTFFWVIIFTLVIKDFFLNV